MKLKQLFLALAAISVGTLAISAQASDRKVMMPITAALEAADAQSRLDDAIKLSFGKQATPKIIKKLGSDKTSQKTNSFGKSDEKACNWAFLSAMLTLQKRAKQLGANGIVNIVSNYRNNEFSSTSEFECHVGGIMAGVAFKADFVEIGGK